MLLNHYFREAAHALRALQTQELKVSLYGQVNDPFESFCRMVSTNGDELGDRGLKNYLESKFAFISFSQDFSPDSQHDRWLKCEGFGVRLVFRNIGLHQQFTFRKIEYSADPLHTEGVPEISHLNQALWTKCDIWEYESEYRLITNRDYCIERVTYNGRKLFFLIDPFPLERVDFGLWCPEDHKSEIRELVQRKYPKARVWQARSNPTQFGLLYEDVTDT